MKRFLVFIVLIFTLLSSGMFHTVFHVCTSETIEKQSSMQCCQPGKEIPQCCKSENKVDIEPSFCCENIPFYYFTPKFNDGSKKKISIPVQPFKILLNCASKFTLEIQRFNTIEQVQIKEYPPPSSFPILEKNCVWII